MQIYQAMTAANGHDANAGRHLLGWAQAAGFTDVEASASIWCFADPGVTSVVVRTCGPTACVHSNYRDHALAQGLATDEQLGAIAAAWRAWAADRDRALLRAPRRDRRPGLSRVSRAQPRSNARIW